MAKAKNPIPEGFHTLTPHITVNGAANFLSRSLLDSMGVET